jgi:transposase
VVADGHGLPIGLHGASACPRASTLAEPALGTVKVPQRRGRQLRLAPSCRQRWKVERCFGWMDNCRRLVQRYERDVEPYRAFCLIAFILCCINLFAIA